MSRLLTLLLATVAAQAGLHPAFPLLDAGGADALKAGTPYSPMATCGVCHDVEAIHEGDVHAWLGAGMEFTEAERAMARPWDAGPSPFQRWDPDNYTLPPAGAELPEGWTSGAGMRHVGGGPARSAGLETDCLLCHLREASLDARRRALRDGALHWAATASLEGAGLVRPSQGGFAWVREAFPPDGRWPVERLPMVDPDATRCGQCHGLVRMDDTQPVPADLHAGLRMPDLVYSPQRVSASGLNLAGKAQSARGWDVHAERLMDCAHCHASVSNPARAALPDPDAPAHLAQDPRGLDPGDYLERPVHQLTGGWLSAQAGDRARLECVTCHDPEPAHRDLPHAARHLQVLACEACHIPELPAGARLMLDWTALDQEGRPLQAWHGGPGSPADPSRLQEPLRPLLLPWPAFDGTRRLHPMVMEAVWLWVDGEPERPVGLEQLQQAWSGLVPGDGDFGAFDSDGDGVLSDAERRLDSDDKTKRLAARLAQLGVGNPRIRGQLRPQALHHGVVGGEHALSACDECHQPDGRITGALAVAAWRPGGVEPVAVWDEGALDGTRLTPTEDGGWLLRAGGGLPGLHVMGAGGAGWLDLAGGLLTLLTLGGVALHGSLRWRASRSRGDKL
jgi:hypothetical protein